MKFASVVVVAIAMLGLGVGSAFASGGPAAAKAKAKKPLVVCKHGCKFRTIQKAVDASGRNAVINIKAGKYVEGVIVKGHKHDGLTIKGVGKTAKSVILEGKNAKNKDGLAQNGVEGVNVNGLKLLNMWARNFASNGFFIHSETAKPSDIQCRGYLMKNLVASYNRAYGLYVFRCIGGRMTHSVGYGHGDSAFYVGATPKQKKPTWASLDHLQGYRNVLGFSGTNARYVNIHDSQFFNNGVGVVPNTLDSEPYEPSADGIMEDNQIFWNNFNYFLPGSGVKTTSRGLGMLGDLTIQFPTGVGVVLLGNDGWKVRNNDIFGNFKWGVATISNPFNEGHDAESLNNEISGNRMGRGGSDTNAVDFFNDGSGMGNCWHDNGTVTYDPGSVPDAQLYPASCPNTIGSGNDNADGAQFGQLALYVTSDPPENQECSWTKHPHPAYKKFKAIDLKPGPQC